MMPASGFLGISLGSPYYSRARIDAYLAWASVNLEKFAFLIGDEIFALTNAVFKDISLERSREIAERKGEDIAIMLERAAAAKGLRAHVFRWRDLTRIPQYGVYYRAVRLEYDINERFKSAVRRQVWTNLGSRLAVTGYPPNGLGDNGVSKLLDDYVLHEIAGLVTISEHTAYALEIYPGQDLEILERCYSGEYPRLDAVLPASRKREFLTLHLPVGFEAD